MLGLNPTAALFQRARGVAHQGTGRLGAPQGARQQRVEAALLRRGIDGHRFVLRLQRLHAGGDLEVEHHGTADATAMFTEVKILSRDLRTWWLQDRTGPASSGY